MFADQYRTTFESLGLPLQPGDALEPESLESMNLKGLSLPLALREYLLIAGGERTLNHSFNRLLEPRNIFVESGRIVFMEENQSVVFWGVKPDGSDNPIVEQGVNLGETAIEWHSEETDCASFLKSMLYWQAGFGGGMSYTVQARVSANFRERSAVSGWWGRLVRCRLSLGKVARSPF